jgi:hypothetical protein
MAGTKGHSDARGTQPGGELGLSMSQRFETTTVAYLRRHQFCDGR